MASPQAHDGPTLPAPVADPAPAGAHRAGPGKGHTLPGIGFAAAGVLVATLLNLAFAPIGTLTGAVVLGVVAANVGLVRPVFAPGLRLAAKRVLRIGVALLGLRLAVSDIVNLGTEVLAVIVVVVVAGFLATVYIGRWMGAGDGTSLLVATGFSICGASAIAAMNGVAEQDEKDVAKALGLVTLCGGVAMVALPAVEPLVGLSPAGYGIWAGTSVHEVAQVVAAAAPVTGALAIAVAVKLTRVVLLAPMLAAVALVRRRHLPASAGRPPLVPLFVTVFLLLVVVRSTGLVPPQMLHAIATIDAYLLAAALFALGTAVRLGSLRHAGLPAALLGLVSTLFIAAVAYAGAALVS